jgi:translocation and assembly module TamB
MKKFFLYFLVIIVLLTGLCLTTLYFIISSERGTQWLVNTALHSVPGKLHYESMQGQLNHNLIFSNVSYQYQGTTLTTDKFAIRWNLMALLHRKLSLCDIKANDLKITLSLAHSPISKNEKPLSLPPLKIHIKNTQIKQLRIESPAYSVPIVLDNLKFNAKVYPELLSVQFITRMTSPTPMHLRLEASGKPVNYQIAVVIDQDKNHWSLQGEGDVDHLKFHTKENQLLGGTIKLDGEFSFREKLKWIADADIKGINPQLLFPSWPGKINFLLKSHLEENLIELTLTELNGSLKHRALTGALHYRQTPQLDHFIDSDLHFGDAHLSAKGKISSTIDLKWDINIPKIQELLAEYALSGSIISQGSLNGTRAMPNIQLSAKGRQLHFEKWSAEQLQLDAHYQDNESPIKLQLDINNAHHDQQALGELHGLLTGTQSRHNIKLNYGLEQNRLNLNANGQFSEKRWQGTLESVSLQSPQAHNWHLQSAAALSLSQESLQITPLCLLNDKIKFCLSSEWQKGKAFTADIQGDKIPLDIINPWLGDLSLQGKINTTAKLISLPNKTPSLDLKIELIPGEFNYIVNDVPRSFHYQGGVISALLSERQFTAKAKLELLQKSTVSANVYADPKHWNANNWTASPIHGDFNLNAPQLDFLAALIPKIAKTRGSGVGHGSISGTLHTPVISATANVSNASFSVPDFNSEVRKMTATGAIREGILSYQGIGSAGEGSFKISGSTQLKNKQLHTHLALQGKNMLISDTPGVKVIATPDLQMNIVDKVMSLTGKLFIPKGEFHSYDYNDTLELPDEISYRQQTPLKPTEFEPVQLTTFIELKLGENITIDSNGLKGKLVGALTINDKAGGATTAFGQLALKGGQYDFRGQPLAVERGILNFNGGPIENPNLNVRAVRRIGMGGLYQTLTPSDQNRIVGINITGTLAKHTLALFSEPDDISPSDTLSYLVLGQSTSGVSGSSVNAKALLGAAQALNLSGSGGTLSRFKSQLEQKLGLSELDITSYETKNKAGPESTIQHTAFVLGRYLSPKLYVNYSFDILDHTNVFRIRYFLNKKWSVQSESTVDGNGLDILYSFERG